MSPSSKIWVWLQMQIRYSYKKTSVLKHNVHGMYSPTFNDVRDLQLLDAPFKVCNKPKNPKLFGGEAKIFQRVGEIFL